MKISNLSKTSTEQIVTCLLEAFEGYFVKMPADVNYWEKRFNNARADKALSWGVFDSGKLIAFVINCIDNDNGALTAYNTGTGVVPAYRGNKMVDRMYEYGLTTLKSKGVQRCTLEVVDKNDRAIRVYKRIGFQERHKLLCFKGTISGKKDTRIEEVQLKDIESFCSDDNYSWDNKWATIRKAGDAFQVFKTFEQKDNSEAGYFIINNKTAYVAQLESLDNRWDTLFSGIRQLQKNIRINNIKEDREDLLSYLQQLKFENTINQLEMEYNLCVYT